MATFLAYDPTYTLRQRSRGTPRETITPIVRRGLVLKNLTTFVEVTFKFCFQF